MNNRLAQRQRLIFVVIKGRVDSVYSKLNCFASLSHCGYSAINKLYNSSSEYSSGDDVEKKLALSIYLPDKLSRDSRNEKSDDKLKKDFLAPGLRPAPIPINCQNIGK